MNLTKTSALVAAATSFALAIPAQAKTKIVVTYPYIAALVGEMAKDRVDVTTLAKGDEDPHFVVPRPSFIGKLRQADLLIINGASLEIGFVPPLIRQANNPRIMPGAEGFVDLSQAVELIEKPDNVSRSEGDIHPEGNPHFILDWHNVPGLARAIADALARADRAGADAYHKNLDSFLARWKAQSDAWDKRAAPLKSKAIIQYHRLFNYFAGRTGLKVVGELEPKPGIPPTSRHLEELIEANATRTVYMVVTDPYHERKSPEGLAKKLSVPWVVLPQDVAAVPAAKDIFSLYDTLLASVLK
ncbi:MAG TPA: zinc ABC transporter substrate-binding protein [Polyangia bacterium]|jgi:ABC-type metal ion transport system, periplasmic component/surface adhesin|nr:zinc ABC transporter substrate-binding protein [Polyangia bacterium]